MAVPRNRHSNARKNKRRSHMAKKPISVIECENCKAARLPHTICQACGHYAGREVIVVKSETE
jgi:large subunit ribosomal protein L32